MVGRGDDGVSKEVSKRTVIKMGLHANPFVRRLNGQRSGITSKQMDGNKWNRAKIKLIKDDMDQLDDC